MRFRSVLYSLSVRYILKLSFNIRLGLPCAFFPLILPTKTSVHLSSPPFVLHAPPPISLRNCRKQEEGYNLILMISSLFPLLDFSTNYI